MLHLAGNLILKEKHFLMQFDGGGGAGVFKCKLKTDRLDRSCFFNLFSWKHLKELWVSYIPVHHQWSSESTAKGKTITFEHGIASESLFIYSCLIHRQKAERQRFNDVCLQEARKLSKKSKRKLNHMLFKLQKCMFGLYVKSSLHIYNYVKAFLL